MLLEQNFFKQISGNELTDTSKSSEVLFSFDAESEEEVNELAKKVEKAGGTVFSSQRMYRAGCMVVHFAI